MEDQCSGRWWESPSSPPFMGNTLIMLTPVLADFRNEAPTEEELWECQRDLLKYLGVNMLSLWPHFFCQPVLSAET